MPIGVVTFAGDENFNLTLRVSDSSFGTCSWEVSAKTEAHLVLKLLAKSVSHFG
jgi:hypothetical protein